MPPTNSKDPREHRRRQILKLIGREPVKSQAALRQRLAAAGIEVNQATLSRDLRDLGVVKSQHGYELPSTALHPNGQPSLQHALQTWLLETTTAQNLIVLRTPPGGAQALGLALDQSSLDGVLGTIAGDDTVLVVCPSNHKAKAIAQQLKPTRRQAS